MSSYFLLGLAVVCIACGAVMDNKYLLVVGLLNIPASIILARCDTIIALLRSKQ